MGREENRAREIAGLFAAEGELIAAKPHGNGHINDTYVLTYREGDVQRRYILQRINHEIFKKPWEVMENVVGVTEFLQKKIAEEGGDPERETMHVVPAKDGTAYQKLADGTYWRMYRFVEGATCYDEVQDAKDFYECALAFGHFQKMLAEYPAGELHETIPNFHNTVERLAAFKRALEADTAHRAGEVQQEIRFILEREKDCHAICDLLTTGDIPLRVTHNDTKLNNIMIDNETGKGICIIDLDTVMPGSALYDFGDSIRFGACTGAEDEPDLSKISCDLELFEAYTKGYIEGCEGALTGKEIEMLPMGAKVITLEQGIRFLTDYLEGDCYYKTDRPGQNLDRTRTQLKMVADMEAKWAQIEEIVLKCHKIVD